MSRLQVRGTIFADEAYAMGKMLDHSAWQDARYGYVLPRNITPSDIDTLFDNNGSIIYSEFSRHHTSWNQIDHGQRMLYVNAIRQGPHCAVLCKHSIDPEERRPINTRDDVESFQPMLYHAGKLVMCQIIYSNDLWDLFVQRWFENPLRVRTRLLEGAA